MRSKRIPHLLPFYKVANEFHIGIVHGLRYCQHPLAWHLAKVYLDSFSRAFPNRYAKLSFETPNYKIRVGKFATRLEGIQTLDTLRVKFPEAFLLKP